MQRARAAVRRTDSACGSGLPRVAVASTPGQPQALRAARSKRAAPTPPTSTPEAVVSYALTPTSRRPREGLQSRGGLTTRLPPTGPTVPSWGLTLRKWETPCPTCRH